MRLLLVEDDQNLSDAIAEQLQKEGYITDCCYDGETALHYALNPEYGYDIVLLDRMLPIIDGLTVLKAMRQKQIFTPVLILTGLGVLALMYFLSRFLIGKAVEPVEDTMKSQKEFIASASHELKAPLAVIQANAEIMESSQKQKIILDECSRMSKLVQSMLALASSDAGNWKMDIRETDVDTLLIETWEQFSESARKKNIRLNLDIEDHYPKTHCDKERISQVLGILLDNAISYSSPGQTIEMGAKVLPQKLAFFVIDHGPGIADAEKAKVFERFYSGDPSRTDKSHFGLGLSIAQEIVRLHHGTIRLTDTPGGGCTFEIVLSI